ncbi:MAG: restriction endonuclease subunit S [Nanoarchaeota archaeon]|nr:restriction endonuclease subunit S [Nanoarchaeota archaeon]
MAREYKQTEAGRIPKAWEVVELEDKITLEYGKGLSEKERKGGKFPVFGSNGVVGYHSSSLVSAPGIIVGRKGTIGAINWSDTDFWPIDTTYYVVLKDKEIDLKWLYYKLIALKLNRLNTATGTHGLNRDNAYSIEIGFPPVSEQKAIANYLLDIGEKLSLQKFKKQKLEKVKKCLMNELLTGKKRIKGA